MVHPASCKISLVSQYSGMDFIDFTACTGLSPSLVMCPNMFQFASSINKCPTYNPDAIANTGLGSSPFARHYLGNLFFDFFSWGYLDGSVLPVRRLINQTDCLRSRVAPFRNPGINIRFNSSGLIAVNHVFLRLLMPRHPPYALSSLTFQFFITLRTNSNLLLLFNCQGAL
jgi:hypothetical protein